MTRASVVAGAYTSGANALITSFFQASSMIRSNPSVILWILTILSLIPNALAGSTTFPLCSFAAENHAAATGDSSLPLLFVGAAKIDITPNHPTLLAGYGHRVGEHERVEQRLFARALVIGEQQPVVQVVVDNCGVPKSLVDRVAAQVERDLGIPAAHVVIASTHTHNAPSLTDYAPVVWAERATDDQQQRADLYTNELCERLVEVISQAYQTRRGATLAWGIGRVHFGGNRRLIADRTWRGFGFQSDGPVDHSLPVLVARDEDGQPLAIWTSYACHCTTIGGDNLIHGDWAGCAAEFLERDFPGCVALVGIGCGADVGPVPSGSISIAQTHGDEVRQQIKKMMAGELRALNSAPRIQRQTIKLPLEPLPPLGHWQQMADQAGFEGVHARRQLERLRTGQPLTTELDYDITTWSFGDELHCVFLPGEVSVDYAVRLKSELDWSRLWLQAWSKDVPCYIPSRRLLTEGGYESDFSMIYYDQPSRFQPEVEDRIVAAVHAMLGPDARVDAAMPPPDFLRFPVPTASQRKRWRQVIAEDNPERVTEILTRFRQVHSFAINGCLRVEAADVPRDTWYDFTGGQRQRPYLRQQTLGGTLHWTTAPRRDDEDQNSNDREPTYDYLVFTGGLGYLSQPQTAGFRLRLQPHGESLKFDLSPHATTWRSDQGDLRLDYLPTWRSSEDSAGFFLLQVPRQNHQQSAYRVEIESQGADSLRWFAVDPQPDALAMLEQLLSELEGLNK